MAEQHSLAAQYTRVIYIHPPGSEAGAQPLGSQAPLDVQHEERACNRNYMGMEPATVIQWARNKYVYLQRTAHCVLRTRPRLATVG